MAMAPCTWSMSCRYTGTPLWASSRKANGVSSVSVPYFMRAIMYQYTSILQGDFLVGSVSNKNRRIGRLPVYQDCSTWNHFWCKARIWVQKPNFHRLPPVADYVGVGAVVTGGVGPLHGNALGEGAIAVGAHAAIRILLREVHSGLDAYAAGAREPTACVQEAVEAVTRFGAAAGCRKFHVAGFCSTLGAGTVAGDSEAVDRIAGVDQYDLTDALGEEGADLVAEIEALVDAVREFAAGGNRFLAGGAGKRGEEDGARAGLRQRRGTRGEGRKAVRRRRLGSGVVLHQCGEVLWPVAEFLVEADVLGAVRKGEQGGAPQFCLVELFHCGLQKLLGDALVPVLGKDGERAEKRKGSPGGKEISADQSAGIAGGEYLHVACVLAADGEIAIFHKCGWVRNAEKGRKGQAKDAICLWQFGLFQRTHFDLICSCHRRHRPPENAQRLLYCEPQQCSGARRVETPRNVDIAAMETGQQLDCSKQVAHWYTGCVTSSVLEKLSNGSLNATSPSQKRVLLLKPRGFCAGVVRAIDIVKIALETFGAPIYVRREIVHNRYVVNELAEKGAIFVHEIDDVPDGQRVIYSAHGVSPAVRETSKGRGLKVIDATCPLVTKVHIEAVKFAKQGYSLVLIGHRDHDEIEGTLGEAPDVTQVVSNVQEVAALEVPDPNRVAYLTQTTLSLDEARDIIHALKEKFPNIVGPHSQDICYATENRQVAVRNVAHNAGLVLVVGSTNSSNSNRLVEVSRNLGTLGYLIDNSQAIDPKWLEGVDTVAVTAGASAPEVLVEDVVNYLRQNGFDSVEEVEVMPENVRFGLPPEIIQAIGGAGGAEVP